MARYALLLSSVNMLWSSHLGRQRLHNDTCHDVARIMDASLLAMQSNLAAAMAGTMQPHTCKSSGVSRPVWLHLLHHPTGPVKHLSGLLHLGKVQSHFIPTISITITTATS